MTDNPAVRAVAHGHCTFDGLPGCTSPAGTLHHPECAVAALASSGDLRAWLSLLVADAVDACESKDGEDRVNYLDASVVAVNAVLHALGGGE